MASANPIDPIKPVDPFPISSLSPLAQMIVKVSNPTELRTAFGNALPGTVIQLKPGVYAGNNYFAANRHGSRNSPIVIESESPENQALINGGAEGFKFSNVSFVTIRNLKFNGQFSNGINIDDGGKVDSPSHHIKLIGLTLTNVSSVGSQAIKMAGVTDFEINGCVISKWGGSASCAVDMVGCHRGIVTKCAFSHPSVPGHYASSSGACGVQAKGGSTDIVISYNRFSEAGARAIQIGGSTGIRFFRPAVSPDPSNPVLYEAKDITVEYNTIYGSEAAIAFVGVDGSAVRFNEIIKPNQWAVRILQETRIPGFVPCRNGVFSDNKITFLWSEINHAASAATPINIGSGTLPTSFSLERNQWVCEDQPDKSKPDLRPIIDV